MNVQENQPQMRTSRYPTRSSNAVLKSSAAASNGNRRALGDISNKQFGGQHTEKLGFVKKHITRSTTKARQGMMDVDDEPVKQHARVQKRKSGEMLGMDMAQQALSLSHSANEGGTVTDFSFVDAEHAGNSLHMPEYVNAMFALNKKAELKKRPNVNYMQRQTEINYKMREILVDWLVEVRVWLCECVCVCSC
jgi:hypothetical protein